MLTDRNSDHVDGVNLVKPDPVAIIGQQRRPDNAPVLGGARTFGTSHHDVTHEACGRDANDGDYDGDDGDDELRSHSCVRGHHFPFFTIR